jgi:predicted MFS family arabinose efflux permease
MLMAAGAGLGAASLYYSQPMLGSLSADLGVSYREIGWIPTLTQLGYALGILLLIPLGDRHDRRQIILIKSVLLALALVAGACSHSLGVLLAVSLAIGLLATVAQDIVPAAATLAPENRRGKIVGSVMTGLLLGILLSRVISGVVGEVFGWRVMFGLAACWVLVVGCVLGRSLPNFKSTTTLSYAALLGSLADLWRRHPVLRQVAVAQGLLSMGFSAFWSTLAVMLHAAPFHLGSAASGGSSWAGRGESAGRCDYYGVFLVFMSGDFAAADGAVVGIGHWRGGL